MNGSDFTFPETHRIRMVENVDYYDTPRPPYRPPVPDSDGDIFIANRSLEVDSPLPTD
jgi:hypothetical protein